MGDDSLAPVLCACASLCHTCWQSVHIRRHNCQPAPTDCVLQKTHELPDYAAIKNLEVGLFVVCTNRTIQGGQPPRTATENHACCVCITCVA